MLLERPLSLNKSFTIIPNLNNRERDRSYMNEQSTYISCFFLSFSFLFCCWFVLVSFFFFFFSSSTLPSSFLSFFSLLVCSSFFFVFLLLSIPAFFSVPLRWCRVVMLKTVVYGNQVRFESLKNSAGTSTKSDNVIYSFAVS